MRSSRLVHAIDTHTEGMPTRVVTGGVRVVPGATMAERRAWAKEHLDDLRGLLMREPHGHAAMSGAILQPPTTPEADWGVLYIETTGFLPMCGHGTIGVATALVEAGLVPVSEPLTRIRLDTPAGPVTAVVDVEHGRARSVSITNVPAFVLEDRAVVDVDGLGEVEYAMVYGGNFYPVIDAGRLGLELDLRHKDELIAVGLRIIEAVNSRRPPVHPEDPGIRGIHHAQFVQPGADGADTRNAVLNVPGYFDRSPCGTGTSAIMALRHHRGELSARDRHVNESMLGTRFTGTVLEETEVAGRRGIVPRITGRAWVTGFSQHLLDPTDPFPAGFTV
ncbi:proline racemase [Actinomadura logoneensis]|uniref:Proline racemase n=1 Tax=Actinomadura logoneensis TaxID=2293572 RepID=A0A372JIS1_9ACTN|nr:proline racemase family protein [Actinomadura logoneensis]RFU39819.1 proline racemase [Actinomadura logoneensis]